MSAVAALYPVALRLAGRPVLVVGGGAVAARRIDALLAAGAEVTVIAPACRPAIAAWAERGALTLLAKRYERSDVAGHDLVLVAVDDPAVSRAVQADAHRLGVWVNAADDADASDFHLPAVARRGPITVAVTTGASSPTLARELRDRLAAALTDDDVARAGALGQKRRERRANGDRPAPRALDAPKRS